MISVPGSEALVDAGGMMKIAAMPAKEAEETLTGVKNAAKRDFSLPFSLPGLPAATL